MKFLIVLFFVCTSLLLLNNCDSTDPKLEPEFLLKLEDVSCTEAWLQLKTTNLQLPNNVTLFINDLQERTFNLPTADTLLYIDSLLPNQNYSFQLISFYNPEDGIKSNKVNAATMDTTSHSFTWQTVTFGEAGTDGSVIFDIAIVNENNIWAVGEIYANDSIGTPDPNAYNAMHWNGTIWELKRIMFYTICGQQHLSSYPAKAIWAVNENDIWIAGGGSQLVKLENGLQVITICLPWSFSINKMWESSSNGLYVVGSTGSIAHYQNGSWTKIESGTDVDLQDIYSTPDGKEIWTCGWSYNNGRVSLLKVNENNVESIWDSETNTTLNIYSGTLLNSLYANGNKEFVLVGGQVLRHSLIDQSKVKLEWIKTFNGSKVLELGNFGYKIKGSNKNNIVVVGDAAMIWHYNGSTWFEYNELHNEEDRLYGLAVTDNLIVAVGKRYSAGTLGGGLLIVGRR